MSNRGSEPPPPYQSRAPESSPNRERPTSPLTSSRSGCSSEPRVSYGTLPSGGQVSHHAQSTTTIHHQRTSILTLNAGNKKSTVSNSWPKLLIFCILLCIGVFTFLGSETHSGLISPSDQARMRHSWEDEVEQHERDRESFESEREQWAGELSDIREAIQQEEERRQPIWGPAVSVGRCTAWDERQYKARLYNIPFDYDGSGLSVCWSTEIETRARGTLKPEHCEDLGMIDGVHGYWKDHGDGCRGGFGKFTSRCVGPRSGVRRYQARLWNLPRSEDRLLMCRTAGPMTVANFEFERPSFCEDKGKKGLWGFWDVGDGNC